MKNKYINKELKGLQGGYRIQLRAKNWYFFYHNIYKKFNIATQG